VHQRSHADNLDAPVRITSEQISADREDRFHRFSLIGWWDQQKLKAAKVLVIGAGALGNEIVKNLALLGVGNVLIADMDRIENSNLSRSVLFSRRRQWEVQSRSRGPGGKRDLSWHSRQGIRGQRGA